MLYEPRHTSFEPHPTLQTSGKDKHDLDFGWNMISDVVAISLYHWRIKIDHHQYSIAIACCNRNAYLIPSSIHLNAPNLIRTRPALRTIISIETLSQFEPIRGGTIPRQASNSQEVTSSSHMLTEVVRLARPTIISMCMTFYTRTTVIYSKDQP